MEYLNNKEFEKKILTFFKLKKNKEKHMDKYKEIQESLAMDFYLLSEKIYCYIHYVKSYNFKYSDKEDILQEGVMVCFEKIELFNPSRGKAFNFLTTCCLNHYKQIFRIEKRFIDFKDNYLDWIAAKFFQENKVPLRNTNKNKENYIP